MKRNCDNCRAEYTADERNLKRGWGLCCSKSCAAKKREKAKPGYNAQRVKKNNLIRAGISLSVAGFTSEGYKIKQGVAYDEFGDPVYNVDPYDDQHPFDMDY